MQLTAFLTLPLLILCTNIAAEQSPLIQFSDGKIASAEEVNQNFNTLEARLLAIEKAGGCSIAQKDRSIVFTCADGTSGALASAGTVIVYPQGSSPLVDLTTLSTGALIVIDANEVILAPLRQANGEETFTIELPIGASYILADLKNDSDGEKVVLDCYGSCPRIYHKGEDCSGQAFVENASYLMKQLDGSFLAPVGQAESIPQVTLSQLVHTRNSVACINEGYAASKLFPVFPYTPPAEITNAAYPAKASQVE